MGWCLGEAHLYMCTERLQYSQVTLTSSVGPVAIAIRTRSPHWMILSAGTYTRHRQIKVSEAQLLGYDICQ